MPRIKTPKMSEVLYEEFMEPLNISAYKLANDIGVPVSRIQDILHDRRKVTVDTSLRLGKYFGVSDRYFLNIQSDIDIRNEKEIISKELDNISPIDINTSLNIRL
ncbi:MAG: HigA family addiction module antidote protein [Solobacterium sp.]|nr:HigA family addiction module antidote protein [Solobacterium sp.]